RLEALHADPAATQLDDAATFEIVEYCGRSLTRSSYQACDVVMCERYEMIGAFSFRTTGRDLVQQFADACGDWFRRDVGKLLLHSSPAIADHADVTQGEFRLSCQELCEILF